MSSTRPKLSATPRNEFGSRRSRRMRRDGQVPGVVYSAEEDTIAFQADGRDIRTILQGGHALFDLEIEGSDSIPVVIKEQQHHPVRGDLNHLDLMQVDLKRAIEAEVAVELTGEEDAPGVKEGGVLEHVTREVTVEALPTDIPDLLTLDVSGMNMHDVLTLEDLEAPEGVKLVADDPAEITLATVTPPRVEAEPEDEVEEEPEVVGEEEEAGESEAGEDSGE